MVKASEAKRKKADASENQPEVPFCLSENVNQLINDFGEFTYNYTFVTGDDVLSAAGTPIEVSHTLFGLKNKWGAALVLVLILLVSILITFFGQMLERAALIITTGLATFLVSHVWLTTLCRGGGLLPTTAFVPCTLPFILAILVSLVAASLILWLTGRFPITSPLMFGMAAGAIGSFLVRQIVVASVPSVVKMWVFDYYWLMAAIVIVLCGLLAVFTIVNNKSVLVLAVTTLVGGYGIATSISGLVNLYTLNGLPKWSFFVVTACLALTGFVVQFCFTGDKASEHREATRRRLRGAPPLAADDKAEPLMSP